ncbi:MAG: hypothetical protein S4CHLAM123_12030 [Chlamydiales bacterium]|nr:hypothetical protein [Chlamydiales bacterium]
MKRLLLVLTCLSCFSLHANLFFTPQMISKHLEDYSEEEIGLIEKDLKVVRSVCFGEAQDAGNRFYLATAGGPGARKTTILERFISTHPEYQEGVYLDPDPRTLKFMVHTYYARSLNPLMIADTGVYDEVIRNAYDKWRAGSNYIVLNLLEEAFAAGRSVVYGTTSTGAHIPHFFSRLKKEGYQIILLLCSCPDEVRYESVDYRNKVVRFYQSSPEDAVSKGVLFPQRMGAYFDYGDQIYIYWSESLLDPERLAAIWQKGELEIIDEGAMGCFVAKYEEDRQSLAKQGVVIPSFDTLIK